MASYMYKLNKHADASSLIVEQTERARSTVRQADQIDILRVVRTKPFPLLESKNSV